VSFVINFNGVLQNNFSFTSLLLDNKNGLFEIGSSEVNKFKHVSPKRLTFT
jgi:hypothetical protein